MIFPQHAQFEVATSELAWTVPVVPSGPAPPKRLASRWSDPKDMHHIPHDISYCMCVLHLMKHLT